MKDKSQRRKPNQSKRGSNEKANKPNTTHDSQANPYTLSPFGIETPKRQRGHLHTRGGSGRVIAPTLLVRLGGGDGLLDVLLRISPLVALLLHPFGLRGDVPL